MKKIFNRKTGVQSVYLLAGALALVIVILVNIAAGTLAERYPLTIDLTSDGLFGLSDETISYIKDLDDQVTIQVLATEDVFENNSTYNAQASEIMRQFEKNSDVIDLVYVDYVSDPTFAAKYPDMTLKQGDVIVSGCGKDRQVKTEELFNYTYDSYGNLAIASSRAEEAILSAVLYVTSDTIPGVAVVTGHGEYCIRPRFVNVVVANLFSFSILFSGDSFTVSYTHLDVYKRQMKKVLALMKCFLQKV